MGRRRIPSLVAKLGDNVNVNVHIHHRPPSSTASWHLPFWRSGGEYELVVSPPWMIAFAMIAVGVVMLCWRRRRRRRYLEAMAAPACNIV